MARIDQLIRKKQWQKVSFLNKKYPDKSNRDYKYKIKKLVKELKVIDRKNTNEIKKIISEFGWPGKSSVGKRVARAAWLLVQHADHDLDFQKKCLQLLERAVDKNEAEKKYFAFLTDRVLVHQNKKQLFGTQFRGNKDGKFTSFPIKDAEKVDLRRKEMGLESLLECKKKMKALG